MNVEIKIDGSCTVQKIIILTVFSYISPYSRGHSPLYGSANI